LSDTTTLSLDTCGMSAAGGCTAVRLHIAWSTSWCVDGDVDSSSTAVSAVRAPCTAQYHGTVSRHSITAQYHGTVSRTTAQ
jgi:hypothetical protein